MKTFAILASGLTLTALMALAGAAQAATFVYVSNAEDGDIGTYTLLPDGNLLPGARVGAGKLSANHSSTAGWKRGGAGGLGRGGAIPPRSARRTRSARPS